MVCFPSVCLVFFSFWYVIFRFYFPDDDEQGILSESIVSQRLLSDLNSEADKLKSMGVMNQIPYRRLVKVMTILQLNIKDGCKMVPINPVRIKDFSKLHVIEVGQKLFALRIVSCIQ